MFGFHMDIGGYYTLDIVIVGSDGRHLLYAVYQYALLLAQCHGCPRILPRLLQKGVRGMKYGVVKSCFLYVVSKV